MTEGLRERKKQRTREAIIDAAMRLFADRGFDHTTIADIAAEADIAPRTFFAYFPAKEDVVFADITERFEDFRTALLADRPAGVTAMDAVRGFIAEVVASGAMDQKWKECRRDLIANTPTIAARDSHHHAQFTAVLAEAVAADLGSAPDDLRAQMVAAAAAAALHTIGNNHADTDDPLTILDEALVFLRGGVEALQAADQAAGRAADAA